MRISVIGQNAHVGISAGLIALWKYRFRAPLRWRKDSANRAVVREIRRLPHRIQAILEDPNPRHGYLPIVQHLEDENWFHWNPKDRYLVESTQDIQRPLKAESWASDLDWELAAKAYQLEGSRYYRNCSEKQSEEPYP